MVKNLFLNLRSSKKRIAVIGVILLILFGFVYSKIRSQNQSDTPTATIQKGTVVKELTLSGKITATEHVNLQFGTSGRIAYVGVKVGDRVKKGQLIANLDTKELGIALQQAKNNLRDKEAVLEKIYDDVKNHSKDETFTQKSTRTTAEVAKDNAYDNVRAAREAFASSVLRSPFEGIVTSMTNPFAGVNIISSVAKYEIINPNTIYFEVTADQTEVTQISINQKVKIILDSFPDKEIEGKVSHISYSPDNSETSTVYKIKIEFSYLDALGESIRLGMTGDSRFHLEQKNDVYLVPSNFINTDTQGTYVKLGNPSNKTYISVGIEGEEITEIEGQFKEGDTVFD